MNKISAVILAGGRSSRMGSNKALLEINEQSFIAGQVSELSKAFSPIIVVSNEAGLYSQLGVQVVGDKFPGSGPLAGIQAGLDASPTDTVFVVPCDMPFVTAELGLKMLRCLGDADGLVLQTTGHLEPLCALYTKKCLPVIEEFLRQGKRKIIDFYPRVNMIILPIENLNLHEPIQKLIFNVNTPQEFEQAKEMLVPQQKDG